MLQVGWTCVNSWIGTHIQLNSWIRTNLHGKNNWNSTTNSWSYTLVEAHWLRKRLSKVLLGKYAEPKRNLQFMYYWRTFTPPRSHKHNGLLFFLSISFYAISRLGSRVSVSIPEVRDHESIPMHTQIYKTRRDSISKRTQIWAKYLVYMGHLWLLSVQGQPEAIWCICHSPQLLRTYLENG